MSPHHQDASTHSQFKQSPHRQRVCSGALCFNDAQFVFAERTMEGYRGIGWNPADLPDFFERLYRKVVVTQTKHLYYSDGMGGWVFFDSFWWKYTNILPGTVPEYPGGYTKIEGELNGLIREIDPCQDIDFTIDFANDWQYWEDENAGSGDDLPPVYPGQYPPADPEYSVIEFTAVSESSVTYSYSARDAAGEYFKLVTQVDMSEPLDVDTCREIVGEMLQSVPLTKTKQAFTGVDTDGSPLSGEFGFLSKGADWNHATVFWDESDFCNQFGVRIPQFADATSDEACQCAEEDEGSEYTVIIHKDRKITYVPAAYAFLPPAGGAGPGSLYDVGPYGGVFWVAGMEWILVPNVPPPTGIWTVDINTDTSLLVEYEVTTRAKKGLLARNDPDDWTVLQDAALDVTCLPSEEFPETTKCFRAYYPEGGDTMAASGNTAVFTIPESGQIIREIPAITPEMSDDCPVPPAYDIDCPEGGDGESDHFADNPCIE